MAEYRIPLSRPSLRGNEARYLVECVESSWISSRGRFVDAFQSGFATKIGAAHGLAVCNGTAALHLALLGLGIGPGDEVIVPTLTYVATANAVTYTGAKPVFVDSLRDTWQIDSNAVRAAIGMRTKAIMPVHLYGLPCDMDAIMSLAHAHNLYVVEDCAEAFGAFVDGRHAGTMGHAGVFSFYGNKTITTGEGGMIVGGDAEYIERCRRIRGQGVVPDREYWHDRLGYNYRMSNVAAAIGLAQLERADELVAAKRAISESYRTRLAHLPLELQREIPGTVHAFWMISALARTGTERDSLRRHLAVAGIETRPVFPPVHTMPHQRQPIAAPVAEDLAARGFNLPSGAELSEDEVDFVCRTIEVFYR